MSIVLAVLAAKVLPVSVDIKEVRLTGTDLSVWFAHSSGGIALGPFADRDEAERRTNNLAAEHLALATLVPFGRNFPDRAAHVGTSRSAGHATIWKMSFDGGEDCCFVVILGNPLAYTARSLEAVDRMLKEFNRRAKRWVG